MSRIFYQATDWIVTRPWITCLLLLVITKFACVGYYRPELVLDFLNPKPEAEVAESGASDGEQYERAPDVNPFSVADAEAIIVVESENFFTPDGAKTLRHVVKTLEETPYVRSVVWMDAVPILNIFGLPEPLLPRETASQARFDNARKKALQNPLVKGQMLSADGTTLLLLVNFDFFFVESNEDCIGGLREIAAKAAAEVSDQPYTFSVTGNTPLRLTFIQQHEASLVKYQLIGYGMIAIMALILFRGLPAVIIVAVAPALGVFWTLGLLPYFEVQDNPFNDVILPVLVSLVGLTDGVHLMVHIRKLRAAGLSTMEAARDGVREVGLACALTSLTTAIGFGSLMLASHETVQEFGFCCVIGVICTFVSVVTTIPLLCSSWLGRRVHHGLEKSLIDQNLGKISHIVDYTLQRTKLFSGLGIGVTVGLFCIAAMLTPDQRRVEALPTDAEPVVALAKMDRAMGGLEIGEVHVKWNRDVPAESGQILQVVTEIDDLLNQEELLGHPLSIRNLLDALPGEGIPDDRMPMLDLLPPPLKRAFYTPERRMAKVIFRVQDIGIAKYGPVFERVKTGLTEIGGRHPDFDIYLSSSGAVWRWENLHQIVVDLLKSLFSASFIIFVVLTIVYRSLRIGLISIIPNLFPLVLAGSFLVLTGQHLEMVSVCSFTICLGIAVDDTIHFLTRYQEECRKTSDTSLAIRNAFTGVGTALIMTTVVLLAGFCTVLFSESREHRVFAWMGAITIGSALFGDMIFLPALLARFGDSATGPSESNPVVEANEASASPAATESATEVG